MKKKKCKNCLKMLIPSRPMQTTCGFECAIEYSNKPKNQKKYIIEKSRELKKEFKENDKSTLKELAQKLVNQYVRLRDLNKPCISCGYAGTERQIHAGHYKPAGNNQQLRYNTINIHSQCSICNNHLSANLVNYRVALIKKIGLNKVEWLESNHEIKKYDVEYLQRLIKTFRKKIKLYQTKFR
jgi:hypothetical protein